MTKESGELGAAPFAVPRHHFIPAQAWARPTAGVEGHWIDREGEPDRWWSAVYSDTVIVTQIDEGTTELTEENVRKTFNFTCSSSGPSLVFAFLDLLDTRRGHAVLEIGTGTGWTAGLLSHLVGEEHVTTVEIDGTLAATAAENVARAGFSPQLVVSDGVEGAPARAPFDRVHVTCGIYDIPYTWISQTRPGGIIVVPWARNDRMVRLTVNEDGTAIGHFYDNCAFMPLRSQRPQQDDGNIPDDERERDVHTDVRQIVTLSPGWEVCLAELVGVTPAVADQGENGLFAVFSQGTSHARVQLNANGTARVTQRGPRNLWDETEKAYHTWTEWGTPGIDRFGMSVSPERQYVWLDKPHQPVKQ